MRGRNFIEVSSIERKKPIRPNKYKHFKICDSAAWIETGYTFWSVCHNGVNRIARLLDRIIQNTWVGDADDTCGSLSGERQQQLCCIRVFWTTMWWETWRRGEGKTSTQCRVNTV